MRKRIKMILLVMVVMVMALPLTLTAAADGPGRWLTAVRGGVLAHDIGAFGHSNEEGIDYN